MPLVSPQNAIFFVLNSFKCHWFSHQIFKMSLVFTSNLWNATCFDLFRRFDEFLKWHLFWYQMFSIPLVFTLNPSNDTNFCAQIVLMSFVFKPCKCDSFWHQITKCHFNSLKLNASWFDIKLLNINDFLPLVLKCLLFSHSVLWMPLVLTPNC